MFRGCPRLKPAGWGWGEAPAAAAPPAHRPSPIRVVGKAGAETPAPRALLLTLSWGLPESCPVHGGLESSPAGSAAVSPALAGAVVVAVCPRAPGKASSMATQAVRPRVPCRRLGGRQRPLVSRWTWTSAIWFRSCREDHPRPSAPGAAEPAAFPACTPAAGRAVALLGLGRDC